MRCLIIVGVLIFLVAAAAVGAENLVMNPSAEESAGNGIPKGWGRYVAAGGVRVAATADEKHSGESAACLELDKWDTPKDAQDAPENHSVSGAIILAENDGYRVDGALPCMPGARYAFSFWYKGTIPAAKVTVSGWPSEKADRDQRIAVPVSGKPLRPMAAVCRQLPHPGGRRTVRCVDPGLGPRGQGIAQRQSWSSLGPGVPLPFGANPVRYRQTWLAIRPSSRRPRILRP